ncbi:MAG: sodium/calcium exchanger rane protein [Acidimicrobiales bacterium]|nr:sodium/calcium exchanger rane protein [Acidimicrobiales bacterium]
MIHVLLLVGAAVAIYVACEWFINAVEWLGVQLKVGRMAVGTLLAAIGTALPESVVTFVAVVFGHGAASKDIGVGAAMGGPLVLSTIAYAFVGFVLISRTRRLDTPVGPVAEPTAESDGQRPVDTRRLARDQMWFLAVFVFKVGLGLVAFAIKPWLGVLFFAAYGVYFARELGNREGSGDAHDLDPLRLQPKAATPSAAAVIVQTTATLAVIFVASQVFVRQLEWAGPKLGLSATVTALLLSPVATELPEIMNALLWVRQGKIDLALANISGAMMIQATVPSGLGILFTKWRFNGPLQAAGITTMAAIVYLLLTMRAKRLTAGRLAAGAAFYVAFAIALAFM